MKEKSSSTMPSNLVGQKELGIKLNCSEGLILQHIKDGTLQIGIHYWDFTPKNSQRRSLRFSVEKVLEALSVPVGERA